MPPGIPGTSYRRWIVLGTVFVNLAMPYGTWYSYSVFVPVHGSLSPFVGWLTGHIGPRRIILAVPDRPLRLAVGLPSSLVNTHSPALHP